LAIATPYFQGMEAIQQWLQSELDYQEGLELYEEHGNSTALLSVLRMGNNSFTQKKLYEAMAALVAPVAAPVPVQEVKQDLNPLLIPLYRERTMLHAQLMALPSQSDRKRVALKVLSLTEKIEKILDKGEAEEEVTTVPLPEDRAALVIRLGNNRKYISKNQHREDKKGEVQRRRDENIRIERILSNGAISQ
jgi:hypothetical protein